MMRKLSLTLIVMSLSLFGHSAAYAGADVDPVIAKTIVQKLKSGRPDLQYKTVKKSEINGVYKVEIVNGPLLYVSESGDHFIAGELFSVRPGAFIPVVDQERKQERAALMAAVDRDEMIVFSPEKVKTGIYVFTDVDCGFCRKLHKEVPAINEAGIEVRYLAFPRAGINSESHRKLVDAWCADDRNATMTKLKKLQRVERNQCENNPVAAQYKLGDKVGVSGTPALILEDGTLIPGYRSAKELVKILGLK